MLKSNLLSQIRKQQKQIYNVFIYINKILNRATSEKDILTEMFHVKHSILPNIGIFIIKTRSATKI